MAKNTSDEIIIKYIKRKLDEQFHIQYASRNVIMNLVFENIKELHKLADYTIYRFDIENFFETADAKKIFEHYIEKSVLDAVLKRNLRGIIEKYPKCHSGLPTSNALAELAGAQFDVNLMSRVKKHGMIFYTRYVDDGLLIFNRRVPQDQLRDIVLEELKNCFLIPLALNASKDNYITKYNGAADMFDYLGYLFVRKNDKFCFGITEEKRKKYIEELTLIVDEYKMDPANVELFRLRLNYFLSRKVFYNNFNSRRSKTGTWDATGLIANYGMLRYFIDSNRIEKETMKFLKDVIKITIHRQHAPMPYFLKADKVSNYYTLLHALKENRSIVFHPAIGWSVCHLQEQIAKVDTVSLKGKSYRESVNLYCKKMKLQR